MTKPLMENSDVRWFPVITDRTARPRNNKIPWRLAETVYEGYSQRYGTDQSLERIAERGGFGILEIADHLGGTIDDLQAQLAEAQEKLQSWEDGSEPAVAQLRSTIEELSRQVAESIWIEDQRTQLADARAEVETAKMELHTAKVAIEANAEVIAELRNHKEALSEANDRLVKLCNSRADANDGLQAERDAAIEERKSYWEAYQRAVIVVRALQGCRSQAQAREKALREALELATTWIDMDGNSHWCTGKEHLPSNIWQKECDAVCLPARAALEGE